MSIRILSWFFTVLRNAVIDSVRKTNSEEKKTESMKHFLSLNYNSEDESEICECFKELLPSIHLNTEI